MDTVYHILDWLRGLLLFVVLTIAFVVVAFVVCDPSSNDDTSDGAA